MTAFVVALCFIKLRFILCKLIRIKRKRFLNVVVLRSAQGGGIATTLSSSGSFTSLSSRAGGGGGFDGVNVARLLSGSSLEERHTSSIVLLFDGAGDAVHLQKYPEILSKLLEALDALEEAVLELHAIGLPVSLQEATMRSLR